MRSLSKYIGSPSERPSYSFSQFSPRKPLCTQRTTVLPWSRPSTRYSNTWSEPSSPCGVRLANRVGGSQAVTVASSVPPCMTMRVAPPSRGSISLRPMNQASTPGPVAIASQTSSGEAPTSISWVNSNGCAISVLLRIRRPFDSLVVALQARVHGDDHAVIPAARRGLVVVLAHQGSHGSGELLRERGSVRGRGEPDLSVHREGRESLACLRRARHELPHVAHQFGRHGDQPARREAIGRARGIGLHAAQRRGRDHVGQGGRPKQPFCHVSLPPLLDELHEPVLLERPQVVVHVLAWEPELAGEHRRGCWFGELGEEPRSDGVERYLGDGRVLDHREIQHVVHAGTETLSCQGKGCRPCEAQEHGRGNLSRPPAGISSVRVVPLRLRHRDREGPSPSRSSPRWGSASSAWRAFGMKLDGTSPRHR